MHVGDDMQVMLGCPATQLGSGVLLHCRKCSAPGYEPHTCAGSLLSHRACIHDVPSCTMPVGAKRGAEVPGLFRLSAQVHCSSCPEVALCMHRVDGRDQRPTLLLSCNVGSFRLHMLYKLRQCAQKRQTCIPPILEPLGRVGQGTMCGTRQNALPCMHKSKAAPVTCACSL